MTTPSSWPALAYRELKDTVATVHLWTQITGKIRLRKMPWVNHSWHVTLYIAPYGFTTQGIPWRDGIFQLDFDFIQQQLRIITSTGKSAAMELYAGTIAEFYNNLFRRLNELGIAAAIHTTPNEMEPAIPFEQDHTPRSYDPGKMYDLWQALVRIHNVFTRFRARFSGKCSPVHFFWGGFDLALTRFSGRLAPLHPGGMPNISLEVMQEAYSHEVSSCGFWPGNEQYPHVAFYSYCYPTPATFRDQPVKPAAAYFNEQLGEFLLHYDEVQQAADPEETLMEFLQSTYEAAALTGNWDRGLEADYRRFERP